MFFWSDLLRFTQIWSDFLAAAWPVGRVSAPNFFLCPMVSEGVWGGVDFWFLICDLTEQEGAEETETRLRGELRRGKGGESGISQKRTKGTKRIFDFLFGEEARNAKAGRRSTLVCLSLP